MLNDIVCYAPDSRRLVSRCFSKPFCKCNRLSLTTEPNYRQCKACPHHLPIQSSHATCSAYVAFPMSYAYATNAIIMVLGYKQQLDLSCCLSWHLQHHTIHGIHAIMDRCYQHSLFQAYLQNYKAIIVSLLQLVVALNYTITTPRFSVTQPFHYKS